MSARLNELRKQKAELNDKLDAASEASQAILEKAKNEGLRNLTSDEDREFKNLRTAFADLEGQLKNLELVIADAERVEQLKASLAKPVSVAGQERGGRLHAEPRRSSYGKKLKSFKAATFGTQADAEDAAYKAGMWCRATIYGDQGAAQWCAENGVEIRHQVSYGTKTQNESTNTAGGYLVFPEMSTAIIDLRETYGTARRFLNVRQMSSDVQLVPRRTGGITGYFATEENAFTESSKTWGQVRLQAQALGTLTKISRELEDDAVISVADDIASEIAYGLAVKEDATLWNGDGTASYGGIIGIRSKFAAGVGTLAGAIDAASGHDTFAEYDAADLIKIIGAIPKYAEGNARWYGHRTAWANTMLRLIAAAGGNAIMDLQAGGKPQAGYLGYPFETDQTLPSALTDLSDTAVFLFGDLDAAVTMGERRGITIDVTRERYWETRQIGIMGWERIDINVHDIGDATNAGPLVALMAE